MRKSSVHRGITKAPSSSKIKTSSSQDIGKFSRVYRSYDNERSHSTSTRRVRNQTMSRIIYGFLSLCGLIFLCLLGWMGWNVFKSNDAEFIYSDNHVNASLVSYLSPNEYVNLTKKFLAVSTIDEFSALARFREMTPEDAYKRFVTQRKNNIEDPKIIWNYSQEFNHQLVSVVVISYSDDEHYIAYITPNEKNEWVIDIDAFFAYSSIENEEMFTLKNYKAKVRAIIKYDSYYNGEFADDTKWLCVSLTPRKSDQTLYGYVALNSPQHNAIKQIIKSRAGNIILVEANKENSMNSDQVEITQVISENWFESDKAFEERMHTGKIDKNN
jgi:hypothetical protein